MRTGGIHPQAPGTLVGVEIKKAIPTPTRRNPFIPSLILGAAQILPGWQHSEINIFAKFTKGVGDTTDINPGDFAAILTQALRIPENVT